MPPARKKAKTDHDADAGQSVVDPSTSPIRRIHNYNDAIIVDSHLRQFIKIPTNTLLSLVVGAAARLQNAVAPLQAPRFNDDRQRKYVIRDHLSVLTSAHLQLTKALNELLAVEQALLHRTAEVQLASTS